MRTYTAHLHPDYAPVLVAEAFSWGAFLFGPLWLLRHRAWIAAGASVAALLLTQLAPPALRALLSFAVLLLLGLTGPDLLRWTLARHGYGLAHVVAGRGADDAFIRLMDRTPASGA